MTKLKVKTLSDLTSPIIALADDVDRAQRDLESHNDGYARRNYVRALFAMVEGSVYLLKQTSLSSALQRRVPMAPAEYALMAEETFDLDNKGQPRSTPKLLRITENLRFTIECVNRVFGSSVILDTESAAWHDFRRAVEIRNRITHPKSAVEFEVTEEEVQMCWRLCDEWFNKLVASLVDSIVTRITAEAPRAHGKTEPSA